jgi:hypothetical protein
VYSAQTSDRFDILPSLRSRSASLFSSACFRISVTLVDTLDDRYVECITEYTSRNTKKTQERCHLYIV